MTSVGINWVAVGIAIGVVLLLVAAVMTGMRAVHRRRRQ